MMIAAVVWLVLTNPQYSLHVGNFPDVPSCLEGAHKAQTALINVGGAPNNRLIASFVCVPADTGKSGDPGPPN